jgi:hypothetical protein
MSPNVDTSFKILRLTQGRSCKCLFLCSMMLSTTRLNVGSIKVSAELYVPVLENEEAVLVARAVLVGRRYRNTFAAILVCHNFHPTTFIPRLSCHDSHFTTLAQQFSRHNLVLHVSHRMSHTTSLAPHLSHHISHVATLTPSLSLSPSLPTNKPTAQG